MIGFKSKNKFFSNFLTILLLISFIGYMVSIFAFMHIHVLPSGEIISHSHFVKKSDTSDKSNQSNRSNHKHIRFELLYLHLTTATNNLLIVSVLLLTFLSLIRFIFSSIVENLPSQNIYFLFSNRAPPVSIHS